MLEKLNPHVYIVSLFKYIFKKKAIKKQKQRTMIFHQSVLRIL